MARKISSLPLRTNFCGTSCSRETINLKTVLNTVNTEKINTKRYSVSKLLITSPLSFFQLKSLLLKIVVNSLIFEPIVSL